MKSRKKTNAQRCREYRERKKLQNTMEQNITAERSDKCSETDQLQARKPKTNAERRRKYYEAQKLKKQGSKKIPKTAKQRNKEYYERKKKNRALNSLNHHSDALRASTSSAAQVSSGDLFFEVPPTTVVEVEGPDDCKQQPPAGEGEVLEEPKPLPNLRQRRSPIPATMSTRSTLRVTETDKEQLARLVRGHPVLYDTRYLYYRYKAQTHYAWQEISRRMLRTESECVSIWKILKESYKGAVRRRELRMDQGLIVKPSKYEDFMSFVKPFLIKTGAAAAVPETPGDTAPRQELLVEGNPTRSTFPAQPQRDNYVEFFRNLGETVKNFPIDVKNRVKNEVLIVVRDAREFVLSNSSVEQLFVVEEIKEEPLESSQ